MPQEESAPLTNKAPCMWKRGLLVGAGSTIAVRVDQQGHLEDGGKPLIPGVDELTDIVVKALSNETQRTAAQTIRNELGGEANVETILSKVRLLERALGSTPVHGLDAAGYGELGQAICDQIGKIVDARLPPERNAYNELIAWISGTNRTHAIEIFTTNYDLLFEEAFEKARAPYFVMGLRGAAPHSSILSQLRGTTYHLAGHDSGSCTAHWAGLWRMASSCEGVGAGRPS
jgi:hypothetical protein